MRKLQVAAVVILGLVAAQASAHEVERTVVVETARAPRGKPVREERKEVRKDRQQVRREVRHDVRSEVRHDVVVRPGSYARTTFARVVPVMDEWSFRGLLSRVSYRVAPGVRLGMVRQAAYDRSFTSAQVARLLQRMRGDERIELLRIVGPRIVDRGSCGYLLAGFRGGERYEAASALGL